MLLRSYPPIIITSVLFVSKSQELLCHPGIANRSFSLSETDLIYIHQPDLYRTGITQMKERGTFSGRVSAQTVGLDLWGQIKCTILHLFTLIPEQGRLVFQHSCSITSRRSPNWRTCKCFCVVKWFNDAMWLSEVSSPLSHRFWHALLRWGTSGGHAAGDQSRGVSVPSLLLDQEGKKGSSVVLSESQEPLAEGEAQLFYMLESRLFGLLCAERVTSMRICSFPCLSTYVQDE